MSHSNRVLSLGCCALICSLLFPLGSCAQNNDIPEWIQLGRAYPARHDKLIHKYGQSATQSVRLYARALQHLAARNYNALPDDGDACLAAAVKTSADAAAYLGCLFAVRSGLAEAHQPKLVALWDANVISFYGRYSKMIDTATRSNDPGGVRGIRMPSVATIKHWPQERLSVKSHWTTIPMHHGTALVQIDGKTIPMRVDTGATGIDLSQNDIKRYDLASLLIPLRGSRVGIGNHVGGTDSRLYYVKTLRMGPIEVSNAYVTISSQPVTWLSGSAIGMSVLSGLRKFSISARQIGRFVKDKRYTCGRMLRTRRPVAEGIARPFLLIPTSVGRLGLFLDSGGHAHGREQDLGLHLLSKEKSRLVHSSELKSPEKVKQVVVEGGKIEQYPTTMFSILVSGIPTHGIFIRRNATDPMLAGSLDFNFLKKSVIEYDFPDKRMCIGRLSLHPSHE